jgi:hypothetical protein
MEYRGLKSANQSTEYRVQSTDYGVQREGVSECKGANWPEAGAKVER